MQAPKDPHLTPIGQVTPLSLQNPQGLPLRKSKLISVLVTISRSFAFCSGHQLHDCLSTLPGGVTPIGSHTPAFPSPGAQLSWVFSRLTSYLLGLWSDVTSPERASLPTPPKGASFPPHSLSSWCPALCFTSPIGWLPPWLDTLSCKCRQKTCRL